MATRDEQAKKTLAKIEALAKGVVQDVKKRKNPRLQVPLRTLSNVQFNVRKKIIELGKDKQERAFFNVAQARKFMQTF
ncbi:MAG TPA: DNA topoisomerase VI, partial [Vulgatibacter sp.]